MTVIKANESILEEAKIVFGDTKAIATRTHIPTLRFPIEEEIKFGPPIPIWDMPILRTYDVSIYDENVFVYVVGDTMYWFIPEIVTERKKADVTGD